MLDRRQVAEDLVPKILNVKGNGQKVVDTEALHAGRACSTTVQLSAFTLTQRVVLKVWPCSGADSMLRRGWGGGNADSMLRRDKHADGLYV
eukprot:4511674-Pleurochrysis_carterae.AAC.1